MPTEDSIPKNSAINWYYMHDGQRAGPVDETQLEDLARVGTVLAETLVWHEGMAEWQSYRVAKPASARAVAIAEPPPIPVNAAVCAECGRTFGAQDMISYGTVRVCAACKPLFVQKLAEGVAVHNAPAKRSRHERERVVISRNLMIASVCLLVLVGLPRVAGIPAEVSALMKSGAPGSAQFSVVVSSLMGSAVWFVLAFCQWRNGGRWGLGIGMFASVMLIGRSLFMFVAARSGRVTIGPKMWVTFLVFSVVALSAVAVVNFWLYSKEKRKSG